MVDLKFDGYHVFTDKYSVTLTKQVLNKNQKSKSFGEIYEKPIGYYGTLHQALNGYLRDSLADEKHALNSAKAVIGELKRIEKVIEDI